MNATTYGVDIAKNVMQLHWVSGEGEIGRKKLSRGRFAEFFAQLQPARIAMEACGGAHHWARELTALGHRVELLPARQVRTYVRGNKDDAADARAIYLAAQDCSVRRVPAKTLEQQTMMALHRARQHWVGVRSATINMLRGLLYEFGIVLPRHKAAGLEALARQRADIDAGVPPAMVRMVQVQLLQISELDQVVKGLEAEIQALSKGLETARRLQKVPGIGPLGASALAATLGDGKGWRNGREFSCCLGLAPSHTGTGGKIRMGALSKRGDPYLRSLLSNGARAVVAGAKASGDKAPRWITQLLLRRPFNVVVMAVAHKIARTAWALVAHGRNYDGKWQSAAPVSKPGACAPAR
jgi:transposase